MTTTAYLKNGIVYDAPANISDTDVIKAFLEVPLQPDNVAHTLQDCLDTVCEALDSGVDLDSSKRLIQATKAVMVAARSPKALASTLANLI